MWQYPITGNQFQSHMGIKFNYDVNSSSANMFNVKGKESLVYEYIIGLSALFQPVRYGLDNPAGLYSDYDSFKKNFVRYWGNALDISKSDYDEIRDIFDAEVSSQTSCKNRSVTSVFFENGKALTVDDCLNAVYEVLKLA